MADGAHNNASAQPGRYYARREPTTPPCYGEAYWKEIVDPDGNRRDRTEERLQHLEDLNHEVSFVNSLVPGRILDVGCGLGSFLSGIEDAWEKHGVEMTEFAISRARRWGRVEMGPLEAVGYPCSSFDVVVMHQVIEHLSHPGKTIAEVRRVLAPGGWLILGTPDFDCACARRFGPRFRLLNDPTHVSLFTNESMHRFLRANGFLIDRVDYPYFETRYFSEEDLLRLFDTTTVSPPFYGSYMTFYCRNPNGGRLTAVLERLGSFAPHELPGVDSAAATVVRAALAALDRGGRVRIEAGPHGKWLCGLARMRWALLAGASSCQPSCPVVDVSEYPEGPRGSGDLTISLLSGVDVSRRGEEPLEGSGVVLAWEDDQHQRGRSAGEIHVPFLFGQCTQSVGAAILDALTEELWLSGRGG